MNDWIAADRALGAMVASGAMEVHEDGDWLAEFAQFRWEFHGQNANSLIHMWSDGRNLTRRIVNVKEQSGDRVVLELQRFGRSKPTKLDARVGFGQ